MVSDEKKILEELKEINTEVSKQNSLQHVMMVGVVYGVGFVIGSAIVAAILVGFFGPYMTGVPFIGSMYERGALMLKR